MTSKNTERVEASDQPEARPSQSGPGPGTGRGRLLMLLGVAAGAILYLVLADGGGGTRPSWAVRATLDSTGIGQALGGGMDGDGGGVGGGGGDWVPDRPPVDLESVAGFARAFVPVPDDRYSSAWRDRATGATLFQATLIYDDESEAIALENGAAAGLLRQHFGLGDEPMIIEGVDSARRHPGPDGFEAVSIRIGRGVTFLGGVGLDVGAPRLPVLDWTHQGASSPRLAALSGVAAARLREVLESSSATATAASEQANRASTSATAEATQGP